MIYSPCIEMITDAFCPSFVREMIYNGVCLCVSQELQFFTGESMNPDGMIAILDYKEFDGVERPVFYFPKYGLLEEKL